MRFMSKDIKIGAHLSTAGGLANAVFSAESMGLNCLQIFGASPRQWRVKMPLESEIAYFKSAREKASLSEVYLHAAYLVNLASPDQEIASKSVNNLAEHFRIAQTLGADGLIFHVGSGKELPKRTAMEKVAEGVRLILKEVPGPAKIILENSAGGGQKLGSFPEEIGEILDLIDSERVAVCFDTAHGLEAGLVPEYSASGVAEFFARWGKNVGWERTPVIHANDSRTAPSSFHDQHENIGRGYIGIKGFESLASLETLWRKTWIMEVPGFDGNGPDRENADLLREILLSAKLKAKSTKRRLGTKG